MRADGKGNPCIATGFTVRASIFPSHLRLRIEKPAGWSRRLLTTEVQMLAHLLFLLLIVVALGLEVKVIVRKR